jgi:hypothetical protein
MRRKHAGKMETMKSNANEVDVTRLSSSMLPYCCKLPVQREKQCSLRALRHRSRTWPQAATREVCSEGRGRVHP